jgi:peroxiredoxin
MKLKPIGMKKYLLLIFISFFSLPPSHAQGCFSDGFARLAQLENSGVTFPKRNKMIQESFLGCKIPDFQTTTITGEPISLSLLEEKVIVINFWFTSCAPCIAEMPSLNKLVEEFKESDVTFISFARDSRIELESFLAKRKFDFKIVASANDIAESYCVGINGWPVSMVVDKSGIVRKIVSGGHVDKQAETYIYEELQPVIKKYLD